LADLELDLLSICSAEHGVVGASTPRVSLRRWIPDRARKQRVREFTVLELDEVPVYIAKLPLSADDRKVAAEYEKLRGLDAGELGVAIPVQAVDGGFIMRYLPGVDFPEAFSCAEDSAARRRLVCLVADEIGRFHRQSAPSRPLGPERVVQKYVPGLQPATPQIVRALGQARVGPTHGDLGPWNIRYNGAEDRVAVLDWEDYQRDGLMALDILNFVFTLPLLLFPEYKAEGFEWLYDAASTHAGPFRGLAVPALQRYARLTDQSARAVAELLPVFCEWMIVRIESEGRSTRNMFYATFMKRFLAEPPPWLDSL
jgi:hypothetical protein